MKRSAPPSVATIGLVFAILGVYLLELGGDGQAICEAYGLVPARPTFKAALASLFLHDPTGLVHVGGNLALLIVLGTLVERSVGHARFLGLYLAGGLAGAGLHIVVNPSSTMPLVGCSASLLGLSAVAAILQPRLLGFVLAFAALEVGRAFAGDTGGASFSAHLGGFSIGVLFAAFARRGRRAASSPRPVARLRTAAL